jgi:hypothetical protein
MGGSRSTEHLLELGIFHAPVLSQKRLLPTPRQLSWSRLVTLYLRQAQLLIYRARDYPSGLTQ